MKILFTTIACACLMQSCAPTTPGPTQTKHITTSGAGFVLDEPPRFARYSISYRFRDLEPGLYTAEVYFADPTSRDIPLYASKSFKDPSKDLLIESPKILRIKYGENYPVRMQLHAGTNSGPMIDSHTQEVNFAMSPEMGRKFGVATQID